MADLSSATFRCCAALLAAMALASPHQSRAGAPETPRVPFGQQPCQSLSAADQATLGMPAPVTTQAFRAPATLPIDNVCNYFHGGTRYAQVGYQAKIDYDTNSTANRSTKHQAPADLPGAFFDRQGGLWFAKNGYYVVVTAKSAMLEQVARTIAAKL